MAKCSSREELDGLFRGNGLDILGFEAEQLHPGDDLTFQFRVIELAAQQGAIGDFAGRGNRNREYDLSLQVGAFTQGARVQRVDGALILVKNQLNLFLTARGLTAVATAGGAISARAGGCNAG